MLIQFLYLLDPFNQPEKSILKMPQKLKFEKHSHHSEDSDDELTPTPVSRKGTIKKFDSEITQNVEEEKQIEEIEDNKIETKSPKYSYKQTQNADFSTTECNYCLDKSVPLEPVSSLWRHKLCRRWIEHINYSINPYNLAGKIKCPYDGILSDSWIPESDLLTDEILANPELIDFNIWPKPEDVLSKGDPYVKCEYCPQINRNNFAAYRCLTCHILIWKSCRHHHKAIGTDWF